MNTLPTIGQVQSWMGLTRQQLLATLVLLALLATIVIALMGAGYYIGEQASSTSNSSLLAGMPRCPRGCF